MPRAWWLPPGGAAAAVTLAVVAATGCTASGGLHASPPPSTKSPIATAAVSTPGHAPQAATIGDPDGVLVPAPVRPRPTCPPLVKYAAGNAGPLFCSNGADDPAALRYFSRLHLKIMQLPADTKQSQAVDAICADVRQTSEGAEYSAYLLAANREHWYFTGIAKVHGALLRLCHQESPAPTPSPSHM